jgi:hypothetical protein
MVHLSHKPLPKPFVTAPFQSILHDATLTNVMKRFAILLALVYAPASALTAQELHASCINEHGLFYAVRQAATGFSLATLTSVDMAGVLIRQNSVGRPNNAKLLSGFRARHIHFVLAYRWWLSSIAVRTLQLIIQLKLPHSHGQLLASTHVLQLPASTLPSSREGQGRAIRCNIFCPTGGVGCAYI